MGKANSQTNPKSTNNKFWQFRNLADDDQKAELLLYGDISERSWWEDAATPKRFADDLAALGDVKEITVYINSGGGDVFAAQAIGNMLERNAATVTAHIDGLCASAATIVACHADKVVAAADGSYMVHPVSMGVCDYLTAEDMIDFSSTVVELSGDSEKQKEVQDIAKCLRTLYSTPIGSQEGDRELGINPNIFVDKPLPVAKGLYVAEVTEKTASFEPRARVVRVDWLDSDVLHGVVIPKVVYELV